MNNHYSIIYGFILFIALGFGGWFYVRASSDPQTNLTLSKKLPDSFAQDVRVISFDKNGQLASKLFSPKLVHYPKDNKTTFIKPQVVIDKQDQGTWRIRADKGFALQGNKIITLQGNVVIEKDADKKQGKTTITTSEITYFPEKQLAETDKLITIKQPQAKVQAVGMRAYLDQGRFELLSQARGHYAKSTS